MDVETCPRGTKKTKSGKCRFTRKIAVYKSYKTGKIYYEAHANSQVDSKGEAHSPLYFETGELDIVRYTRVVTPIVARGITRARR